MGYATSESIVRVSVFKPTGKWVQDLAIDMGDVYNEPIIHDALEQAMRAQGYSSVVDERICVCLEPYHKHSHPIMLHRMKTNGR